MIRDPFEDKRRWYREFLLTVLQATEPIDADNIELAELLCMEGEVDAAKLALAEAGPPAYDPGDLALVQQEGTKCMSTSLANGMLTLGEPLFQTNAFHRVQLFTDDVVDNTSSFGKPGEYRSVDDLFKYLESGRLRELELDGDRFEHDYRVRLTNSLLDVAEALWTGKGRLVIQRRAHAHLAFGLEVVDGEFLVRMRDPMRRDGPGYDLVSLDTLRQDYLWSPLKKIPRLMGPHAFPQLQGEQLLGHLDRYDTMENLGVDCPSALVFRAQDAPPLLAPPEQDPQDS
jgi:hypothetical protein